jgi:hypothetical protein
MEYQIVSVIDDKEKFAQEINRLLSEGWELYGSPFCTTWQEEYREYYQVFTEYYQAMIKRAG